MTESTRFSLIIPAWNEEAYLPRLLDTVDEAKTRYRGGADAIEVIVADNASTDATASIARERGCRVTPVQKRIIAAVRNGGAAVARGEVLCFVDADFRIHPETFNAIDRELADERIIGGSSGIVPERWSPGIMATFFTVLPLLRVFGMDGGVWFCRRADFDAVGGYNEEVPISEDVRFLWALRRLGRSRRPRQKLTRGGTAGPAAKAIASARKFDKHGEWHFLTDVPRMIWWILFAPKKFEQHVRAYWYEDER